MNSPTTLQLFRVIYVYTDGKNYKVGKAERWATSPEEAARIRIKEQGSAAVYGNNFRVVMIMEITTTKMDALSVEAFMHDSIQNLGYRRLDRTFEFSETDISNGLSDFFCKTRG